MYVPEPSVVLINLFHFPNAKNGVHGEQYFLFTFVVAEITDESKWRCGYCRIDVHDEKDAERIGSSGRAICQSHGNVFVLAG